MQEQKLLENVIKKLQKKYPKELITMEPSYSTDSGIIRPDIIVNSPKGKPLLVIEIKGHLPFQKTYVLDQLKQYMQKTEAPYGALIGQKFNSIIQINEINGREYEVTLSDFPDAEGKTSQKTKPFQSIDEFRFHLLRIYNLLEKEGRNEFMRRDFISEHIIQNLHRKLVSEQKGINIHLSSEKFIHDLEEIDKILSHKYELYDSTISPPDSLYSKIIFGILQAFSIKDTKTIIKKTIVEDLLETFDQTLEHYTPIKIADFLVKLANVEKNQLMLDVGSGSGNILRKCAEKQAIGFGVEYNNSIANSAIFFDNLLDMNITILKRDFLKTKPSDILNPNIYPSKFHHVFLDPPMGSIIISPNHVYNVYQKGGRTEDIFLRHALDFLQEGGLLTAIIPLSMLYRGRYCEELRKHIKENYRINTIIEVESGLIFPRSSISTAIIQLTNKRPKKDYDINVAVVKGKEDIDTKLTKILKSIETNSCQKIKLSDFDKTLVPSSILVKNKTVQKMEEKYRDIAELKEVAKKIEIGLHVKRDKLLDEGIPYIQISDVTGSSKKKYFMDSNVESMFISSNKDVLISIKGTIGVVHIPEKPVVASSSFAIVRFNSEDETLVYSTFFKSEFGKQQFEAFTSGTYIPNLSIKYLGDMLIPLYSKKDLKVKAEHIREITRKKNELKDKDRLLSKELNNI